MKKIGFIAKRNSLRHPQSLHPNFAFLEQENLTTDFSPFSLGSSSSPSHLNLNINPFSTHQQKHLHHNKENSNHKVNVQRKQSQPKVSSKQAASPMLSSKSEFNQTQKTRFSLRTVDLVGMKRQLDKQKGGHSTVGRIVQSGKTVPNLLQKKSGMETKTRKELLQRPSFEERVQKKY